jgi:hypothetical protein
MAIDFDALDLVRTQNKSEQHDRQKIKFLEDRISVLEKSLESHARILARFQMTEGKEQPLILTKEMEIEDVR